MLKKILGFTLESKDGKRVFRSVQSLSRVRLFATPWTAARQASLSITNSRSLPKLMSTESVISSGHLILCHPRLLLPSIFPRIRVFYSESAFHITWPTYWSFSFSIRPSIEYSGLISFRMDWLDLLAVQGTLKSLLQHHSSKASILRCSAFFKCVLHVGNFWKIPAWRNNCTGQSHARSHLASQTRGLSGGLKILDFDSFALRLCHRGSRERRGGRWFDSQEWGGDSDVVGRLLQGGGGWRWRNWRGDPQEGAAHPARRCSRPGSGACLAWAAATDVRKTHPRGLVKARSLPPREWECLFYKHNRWGCSFWSHYAKHRREADGQAAVQVKRF